MPRSLYTRSLHACTTGTGPERQVCSARMFSIAFVRMFSVATERLVASQILAGQLDATIGAIAVPGAANDARQAVCGTLATARIACNGRFGVNHSQA